MLFCPICRDVCRDMMVVCGPDSVWKDFNSEKLDHILYISGSLHIKTTLYNIKIIIDCLKNSFEIFLSERANVQTVVEKAGYPYLFFHIESNCSCTQSWSASADLELDLLGGKIKYIALEREEIWIPNYIISYNYDLNRLEIDRRLLVPDEDGEYVSRENKPVILPIFELDFKDLDKTVKKIKTMITFS